MSQFRVAVDYGTSTTVAFLQWPDGRIRPLLFDDSPLLPSAVYLEDDGRPLTGRDAVRSARFDPARFEANPKRRIDDGEVLLGADPVPVSDLIAATLRRVWQEATRIAGGSPGTVTLTHPVAWGERRRQVLLHAADRAGLPAVSLVPEPVAAATYFAVVLGQEIAPGRCVVVYDLGAGTFDVSVVRRERTGFSTLSTGGLPDLGGLDLDAIVVDLLRGALRPEDEPAWQRLATPGGLAQQRAFRELWDGAREAKEALSRRASAPAPVPGVAEPQHVTRSELESAAAPVLAQTVALTRYAIESARVRPADIAGLFLVGGSTRVPLVASMLHRATGMAPTVIEQPELVVAEGALHVSGASAAEPGATSRSFPAVHPPAAPTSPPAHFPVTPPVGAPMRAPATVPTTASMTVPTIPPVPPSPVTPSPVPAPPDRRRRRTLLVGSTALLCLLLAASFVVWLGKDRAGAEGRGPGASNSSAARSSPPSPSAGTSPVAGVAAGSTSGASPTTGLKATATATATATARGTTKGSPTPKFTGPIKVTYALVKTRLTYDGTCPPADSTILLYADITANGPTDVVWDWKSDPGWDSSEQPHTMHFSAAGTQRTSPFLGGWSSTPGSSTSTMSYWVQFVATSPITLASEQLTWTVTCHS